MKKRLILLCLILLLFLVFLNTNSLISILLEYTTLFINNLFLYTFIMYVISNLLIDYGLLEFLKPKTYLTIMSMISGFPSGSKYICDLLNKNYISLKEANYLVTYNHYPNPLFVLGAVSTIISKTTSIKLLLSIYLASFLTSKCFRKKGQHQYIYHHNKENIIFVSSLSNAIVSAMKTIILIYGTSIFSVIIAQIITDTFSLNSLLYCITNGIFDLTKGIFSTSLIENKRISSLLILLFINLSSLSIHLQVKTLLDSSHINYSSFLKGRIISTIFSILIFNLLYNL